MNKKSTNPLFRLSCLTIIITVVIATSAWAQLPAAPSNLTATAISSSQINLQWTDNSTDESFFRIERSSNGTSNWIMLTATNANVTSYSVTGLAANTTYYYRIRAEKVRVGVSAFSNVASATTHGGAFTSTLSVVAAPSNLTATAVSSSQINLSWVDNSTDESFFRIERSVNGTNNWIMLTATNANVTSYSVTGLAANTTYYYRVRAERVRYGVSAYSNTASATTLGTGRKAQEDVRFDRVETVSAWPNPASDRVTVQVAPQWQQDATITLQSTNGQIVTQEKTAGPTHTFDVSNLPKGMYVIRVAGPGSTFKIFVQ